MKCSGVMVLLGVCLGVPATNAHATAGAQAQTPTSDLSVIVTQIRDDHYGSGARSQVLSTAGLKLIKNSNCPSLDDALFLLTLVENGTRTKNIPASRLSTLMNLLPAKYSSDPAAMMRVWLAESEVYRVRYVDSKQTRATLARAEQLLEAVRTQEAISELKLYTQLGQASLSVAEDAGQDPTGPQQKALKYFQDAVNSQAVTPQLLHSSPELAQLYAAAADEVVELTPMAGIKDLSLWPVAFPRIRATHPAKAKYLQFNLLVNIKREVGSWLEERRDRLPAGDPMKLHLQAVLEYLIKTVP